jgi:thiol-disulfide isomerase/thioredoxin
MTEISKQKCWKPARLSPSWLIFGQSGAAPAICCAHGCGDRAGLRRQAEGYETECGRSGQLAERYRVQGIPTLLVFKDGQVAEQIVGAVPKDQITKALARHLG